MNLTNDPEPWVSTAPDFERYANEGDYEGRHSVIFEPRTKRYKVVQDARGHWGIWDTEEGDFASWGEDPYTGAEFWEEIILYSQGLNFDNWRDREEFEWDGEYFPREGKK